MMATNAVRKAQGYQGLHERARSLRVLVARRCRASARGARCGEWAAPSAADCGAAKDSGAGPVEPVGAVHHGPGSTPRTGVAHGGPTRSTSHDPSLASGRILGAVATTFSAAGSTFYGAGRAHPRDLDEQSALGR